MVKNTSGDINSISVRLSRLEHDVVNLAQIASQQATGLDKLSRVVELQTGTLHQLLTTAENQTDLLEGVANAIYQLNSANQETQDLLRGQQNLLEGFNRSTLE